MRESRIHILGASGSGTTTLGKSLSEAYDIVHFDSDDFYWMKSDPPYQKVVPREERQVGLRTELSKSRNWVLSGSLCGWGDFAIPYFTLVVFLYIPKEVRMERLRRREIERYGLEILDSNHPMHQTHLDFMAWADRYDNGGPDMRSRIRHEEWMKELPVEVLRIEGEVELSESIGMVRDKLNEG